MADLKLKISIKEKNDRGQEVELVKRTFAFKPHVSSIYLFFYDADLAENAIPS